MEMDNANEKPKRKSSTKNTQTNTSRRKPPELPKPIDPDAPKTGTGGKYNFPNARYKQLEQDPEKKHYIGQALNNCLMFYEVGKQSVTNDDELCERLDWYFKTCMETNQLPTVEKMCLAIGYVSSTIWGWANGKGGFSSITSDIIKKAKEIIASSDAELALGFKIQPIVYMFRAKNFYGMKDQQEVVVNNQNALDTGKTADEVIKRLSGDAIIFEGIESADDKK